MIDLKKNTIIGLVSLAFVFGQDVLAQDTIRYTGKTLSNIDYHHGQLRPAIGVHARQTMRANRENPAKGDGFGWTYNHASMLAYWNGTFYMNYLSDSVGEHIPPSQTLLQVSKDGYEWSAPTVIFPRYQVPDGTSKPGDDRVAKDLEAIMHQRMGFYVSSNDKLLTLAYYGISLDPSDSPNDGQGIGRVVREIKKDGTFGPIYFIRYNEGWNERNTDFPFYKKSKDKAFIRACEELMSKPLMMQQWVEEADRDDPLIPLQRQFKAFSYYHLPDNRVVGLWKHALTSISDDGGKTWKYDPVRAPGFVNGNAKIWGQRTADGKYATVYNPSEFRWPLAISNSEDGLEYTDLLLVHGEISPMRYGGHFKSYGPQYVRGILKGNGTPPDEKIWVTYSMNKEDIWVTSIPTPVTEVESGPVNDVFDHLPEGKELDRWNIYSLQWGPVEIHNDAENVRWLSLKDSDPFDYSRAERVIPQRENLNVEFIVKPDQNDHGMLQIEFLNGHGLPAVRLVFDEDGLIKYKAGYRMGTLGSYEAGKEYKFEMDLETSSRSYRMKLNGQDKGVKLFHAPVHSFERIMFRTGEERYYPTPDSPGFQEEDLDDAGRQDPEATFFIKSLIIK